MLEYIDIDYIPNDNDIVCEYMIEPASGVDFQDACTNIAGESSIDTWSDILTLGHKQYPSIRHSDSSHIKNYH